jgi:hypothetical protein
MAFLISGPITVAGPRPSFTAFPQTFPRLRFVVPQFILRFRPCQSRGGLAHLSLVAQPHVSLTVSDIRGLITHRVKSVQGILDMSEDNPTDHPKQSAADRDKTSPVWDMSQERAFVENLLGQRFNFFLVFFSVVLAGSVNAKTQIQLQILLGIGSAVSLLFASVLGRSQEKLDLILDDLFDDDSHPATIINNRAKKSGSRRRWIGVAIPRVCCAILILGFILSLLGCLRAPN